MGKTITTNILSFRLFCCCWITRVQNYTSFQKTGSGYVHTVCQAQHGGARIWELELEENCTISKITAGNM